MEARTGIEPMSTDLQKLAYQLNRSFIDENKSVLQSVLSNEQEFAPLY
jgi:hypothetical protein